MNNFISTVVIVSCCITTVAIASVTLTPNTNNGKKGNIPSGYSVLNFNLSNGNWVENLTLPNDAKQGDQIHIKSTAGFSSTLDASNTDLGINQITINKDGNYIFIFNAQTKIWETTAGQIFTPKSSGNTIPTVSASVLEFQVKEADWVEAIQLPQTAKKDQILIIKSDAIQPTKIDATHTFFLSSFTLHKGQKYVFQFNDEAKKWVALVVPTLNINVENNNVNKLNSILSSTTAAKKLVDLKNGAWVPEITLPSFAGDRDRIVITSKSTWETKINNTNLDTTATLRVNEGDQYEFIFIADRNHWALVSSPKRTLEANQNLTEIKTPITYIDVSDLSWQANLGLPNNAQNNDKVVINNTTSNAVTISANGLSDNVSKGGKNRYSYHNGQWKKDSVEIDILLIHSPQVEATLGKSALNIRMQDGLRLTNVALERSQAKAYYREVGHITVDPQAATLRDSMSKISKNKMVIDARESLNADASIYQGEESDPIGCGWGYTPESKPTPGNASNLGSMLSVLNLACSTLTYGHELGHNMSINHGWERKNKLNEYNAKKIKYDEDTANGLKVQAPAPVRSNFGFTHPLIGTLLGVNNSKRSTYYSNVNLYDPKYGIRLGVENEHNAVENINLTTPFIAALRKANN